MNEYDTMASSPRCALMLAGGTRCYQYRSVMHRRALCALGSVKEGRRHRKRTRGWNDVTGDIETGADLVVLPAYCRFACLPLQL